MRPVHRRVLWAALLGLVVGAAVLWRRMPSAAAVHVERGRQLAAAQLFSEANAAYIDAVRTDPRYAPAHRALAELATRRGDLAGAIGHWRDYVALMPRGEHAWCRLAYLEALTGLETPALHDAEHELGITPDCERAHLVAGILYARKSDARAALDHLGPAARAYAGEPQVQLVYGRVLALSGDYDRAEQVLNQILVKDPKNAGACLWLGYLYARRPASGARTTQAERFFKRALDLQPGYPEANFELARLYLREGRPRAALPHAERAVAQKRHYTEALFTLVGIYATLGRADDALRARMAFTEASALARQEKALLQRYAVDPGSIEVAVDLGRVEMARGYLRAALVLLEDAARRAPDDPRLDAALKDARRQMRLQPEAAGEPMLRAR